MNNSITIAPHFIEDLSLIFKLIPSFTAAISPPLREKTPPAFLNHLYVVKGGSQQEK
jgi:hypothetical protein